MFNFHKPKVYRSTTGCCICKAKSSSSRFTDSKKYEEDFIKCFMLEETRQGEICNACVLLVKRFKKLPDGCGRNWKHVVDARAGPGMKSMSKFKNKNKNKKKEEEKRKKKQQKEQQQQQEREETPTSDMSDNNDANDDVMMEDDFILGDDGDSSRSGSLGSDCEDIVEEKGRRRKATPRRRSQIRSYDASDFIDSDYWAREEICCGFIFRGMCGEVMADPRFIKPCPARLAQIQATQEKLKETVDTTTISDSSSDSGYDESSNPGALTTTTAAAAVTATTTTTTSSSSMTQNSAFINDSTLHEDKLKSRITNNNNNIN